MRVRGLEVADIATTAIEVPSWLRQLAASVMTASAAVLYAIVLGIAIVRTLSEGDPAFSDTMVRAAAALSGLVGSVVTTGFARSGTGVTVQIAGIRRESIGSPISWVKRNFFGLANTLGLPLLPELVLWTEPDPSMPVDDPARDSPSFEVDEPAVNRASLIVSVLYFAVFFVVGLTSFVTSLVQPEVPELLSNAAWVWLGCVISAAYSFFALNSETAVV
jgi:hypothetical protein